MLFKIFAILSLCAVAKAGLFGASFGFNGGHLPAPALRYGAPVSFEPPQPFDSYAPPAPLLLPRPAPLILPRPAPLILPRPAPLILPRPAPFILPRPAPLHIGGHFSAGFGFSLGAHIRPAPLSFSPLPVYPVPNNFGFDPIFSGASHNIGHGYAHGFSHSSYGH
ncbi:hypothetical protein RN001_015294 [Aquatica leii]|uniref:Uncharacterized protein n=1 Tax=Aquatica leii TaxID=1421715 RepID=A0AAN7NVG9_9COLE|nr:hypothetical protein RN001_015294 [Aquatica leii]